MSKDKNIDELFSEENIPVSNWFKFDVVGAKVSGIVTAVFEKESTNSNFPAQRCFTLKQANGDEINVGLKKTSDYLMGRTNGVAVGDTLGFMYKADIPSKVKGNHPAKSIEVYLKKAPAEVPFE